MAYKVTYSPRAKKEIFEAFDFYEPLSKQAVTTLRDEIATAAKILCRNPFFQVRYKNIRAYALQRFPYIIFFHGKRKNQNNLCQGFFQHKSKS